MKTKHRKRKPGIRRCRSCGEIIYKDGEWVASTCRATRLCPSCNYIGCNSSGRRDRRIDGDLGDMIYDSGLDEFDYEMIGDDPDFDLEYYLR